MLGLVLICSAQAAQAQQRLGLAEAIGIASSRDDVRQAFDATEEEARSEWLLARTLANPTLVLEREEVDGPILEPGEETSVMLVQPLELGGRRAAGIRAAEAGLIVAQARVERDRMALRHEVTRDYYAVVDAEMWARAQARSASALQALAEIAGRRKRGGDLSGYEAGRIAQAATQAHARQVDAEAGAALARARLAAWVGDVALTAELDAGMPSPAPDGDASIASPELELLAAKRAQAQAAVEAARRLSLPASVGVGRKRIRQGALEDDAVMLELAVDLPVFDRRQAERAHAGAQLSLAEARHERALRQVQVRRATLRESLDHLLAAAARIESELLPEATRLTAIAQASFGEGELDLVGLLDAYEAEADLVEQALHYRTRVLDAVLELETLSPAAGSPVHSTPEGDVP